MRYKIKLENLEIESIVPHHYEEIKSLSNQELKLLNYDSSEKYGYTLQVGKYEIGFKEDEVELIL